jgi:hypothetical protein
MRMGALAATPNPAIRICIERPFSNHGFQKDDARMDVSGGMDISLQRRRGGGGVAVVRG